MTSLFFKLLWHSKHVMVTCMLVLAFTANGTAMAQTGTDNPETTEQESEKGKKDKGKKDKKKDKEKKKGSSKKDKKKDKKKAKKGEEPTSTGMSADDSLANSIARVQDTTVGVLDTTDTHAAWLCGRYHRGKMYFIDKNYFGIKIKRKRKKEIWYNLTTDNKLTFKIAWESPCYYHLIFKKSKKPVRFRKGTDIGCKVTACIEDYYDCVCDVNAIMQYVSVQKDPTNKEVKLKIKKAKLKLEEEEKEARMAEQKAKFEEGKEEGEGEENAEGEGEEEEEEEEAKKAPEGDGDGDDGEGKEKKDKDKKDKEKKEKKPKEKKEKKKKEKKEKAPKEKKEKKSKEKKDKDKDKEEEKEDEE